MKSGDKLFHQKSEEKKKHFHSSIFPLNRFSLIFQQFVFPTIFFTRTSSWWKIRKFSFRGLSLKISQIKGTWWASMCTHIHTDKYSRDELVDGKWSDVNIFFEALAKMEFMSLAICEWQKRANFSLKSLSLFFFRSFSRSLSDNLNVCWCCYCFARDVKK